jgi:hypothetical protein
MIGSQFYQNSEQRLTNLEKRISELEGQLAPILEIFSDLESEMYGPRSNDIAFSYPKENAMMGAVLGGTRRTSMWLSPKAIRKLENLLSRLRIFMESREETLPGHHNKFDGV